VAAAVTAHLDGVRERLRRAELERAAAEVRTAEERKRRRVQLRLLAAVLTLVVAVGGAAWWAYDRRSRTGEAVTRALAEGGRRREDAASAPFGEMVSRAREAVVAARLAAELAGDGFCPTALREEADAALASAEEELAAVERDRQLLTALLNVYRPRETPVFQRNDEGLMTELAEPGPEEQYAAAFREWGLDVDATPADEAAARVRGRSRVVAEVAAALDAWAAWRWKEQRRGADWRRPAQLMMALDDTASPWRREFREVRARGSLERDRAVGDLRR
jgi:hypothetical protein